jgi:hypothetical protein
MGLEEIEEEIEHQKALIKSYRKRMRVLEQQAAAFGLHVPPHIQIEIDELAERIEACKKIIEHNEHMLPKVTGNPLPSVVNDILHQRSTPAAASQPSSPKQRVPCQDLIKVLIGAILDDRDFEAKENTGLVKFVVQKSNLNLITASYVNLRILVIPADNIKLDTIQKFRKAMEETVKRTEVMTSAGFQIITISCFIYENTAPTTSILRETQKQAQEISGIANTCSFITWAINNADGFLYIFPSNTAPVNELISKDMERILNIIMKHADISEITHYT